MNQYLVLIQDNVLSAPSSEEWRKFFREAIRSGMFKGGSEVEKRILDGNSASARPTDHISGYMRFDTDDPQPLLEQLAKHPVVMHGGTVELCELPRS